MWAANLRTVVVSGAVPVKRTGLVADATIAALLKYNKKFIFPGVVLWTESGKPDLWWLPSHHESPPQGLREAPSPPVRGFFILGT
jgi:hypothetical protein